MKTASTRELISYLAGLLLAALIAACGGGGGGGGGGAPPAPHGSVLLAGPPSTPAPDALINLPPRGADPADIVNGVILTRLELRLAPDATVGQVNAAL